MRWGVLGILFFVAVVRILLSWKSGIEIQAGQSIKIRETVGFNLTEKYGKQFLTVKNGVGHREIEIEIPEAKKLKFGDKVQISGKLKSRVIGNRDVRFMLVIGHFSVSPGTKNLGRLLLDLRRGFEGQIRRSLGGDEGELLAGIVLGDTGKLSWEATESFRKVGLAHVVAASGYNVSVIAGWILAIGGLIFHRKAVMLIGIFCISLYMFMAGLQPAVVRASVMGIMGLLGLLVGRKTDGGWALAVSVLFLVIVNPIWITDIGFQLSATSMAGVLTVQPPIISFMRRFLPKFAAEGVGATVAAMIFTQPLIWHYFGTLSLAAPVVNGLLIWLVPLMMEIGILGLLVGIIWEVAGQVVLWGSWPLLRAFIGVSEWVGTLGWSQWHTENLNWYFVAGYYGVLVAGYWRIRMKTTKK